MNGNNNNNNDSTAMKQNEKWMSVWNNNEIKWNVSEGIEQSFSCCVTWLRTRIKFKNTFKQEVYINYSWKWMWKRLDNEPKCLIATLLSSPVFLCVCVTVCAPVCVCVCVCKHTECSEMWRQLWTKAAQQSRTSWARTSLKHTLPMQKSTTCLKANMNE